MKVMLFEDNLLYKESMELLILSAFDMELCASYDSTLKLSDKIKHHVPDVVLMDINIQPVDGIKATALIKENFPDVKICMQTVFDEEDKIFASLCSGASGYVLKNASTDSILQALREVYSGGCFFTPSVAIKVLQSFQDKAQQVSFVQLSQKEKEILKQLVDGLSYKMIAHELNLSYHTIHTHIKHIYEKLHVNSKSEAVAKAIKNKLV